LQKIKPLNRKFSVNRYVVGYLINSHTNEVCLIKKNRPPWQKGRLNGVGGHIEAGESPQEAMTREFFEEAGVTINWRQFLVVTGNGYELFCFTAKTDNTNLMNIHTVTDEIIGWYSIESLPDNILPNLKWIIPMANYKFEITGTIYHESEEC
jgi:8-oxo-dGTP diphosphatase